MRLMNKKYLLTIIITAIVAVGLTESRHFFGANEASDNTRTENQSAIHSQYAGQEARGIKSLSQDDIEGLLAGAGTPFGGMAKPAELNGYPGPRHVLDAIEAGEFEVTNKQQTQIQNLYDEMKAQAIALGEQIIAIEQKIDDDFTDGTVTEERLQSNISESAQIYEQLRFVHLKYHLSMVDILTSEQVTKYNTLRGYIGDENDPCENIPEGHDPELWKMHNNCE